MPSGYSGTPLSKKLGIKPGSHLMVLDAPNDYNTFFEEDISDFLSAKNETPDIVHLFVRSNKEFEKQMKKLEPVCIKNPAIAIWVSWYKKTSGIATDITETIIRNYALQHKLVDIKVCAVSEEWSGLKLVVPVALRKKH
jgi:hypothetical protein